MSRYILKLMYKKATEVLYFKIEILVDRGPYRCMYAQSKGLPSHEKEYMI